MHTPRVVLVVGLLGGLACIAGPQANAAPASASALPEVANRASMETMQIPSHGELMNALVYVAARNVLIVTADDGFAGMNDAFAAALSKAGDAHVTTQHFATDHSYSDKRIELSQTVLAWLAGLPK